MCIVVTLAFVAPATAQDDDEPGVTVLDEGDESPPETQVVRDDDTSDNVGRIRRDLVLVAVVMSAALVVFAWHTSPSRRVRIATQRAGRTPDEVVEE